MNRVYVAMQDGVDEPAWLENVEPFVQKALTEFSLMVKKSQCFCATTPICRNSTKLTAR